MKIAIVHDWLVTDAGAEKALRAIVDIFPKADIYSIVDFLNDTERNNIILGKHSTTSFIQKLPFSHKHFRNYLPLFPKAIESLKLSKYDLIISSSWAFAKGVKTTDKQIHICYNYTPIRYAWDLYDVYTKDIKQPKKWLVQKTLQYIRKWDFKTRNRVNYYIAISEHVQKRINNNYEKDSVIIHPPVDTQTFICKEKKEEFYLTVSRLVPYKKTRLIIEAFNENGRPLVVIGSGEEYEHIKKMAKPHIKVMGWQSKEVIIDHMQRAKAFVYTAEEDFGIVPVEAMSCGTPVIAYGIGGIRDSVVENETGVFFNSQDITSLNKAISRFEKMTFDYFRISQHAKKFDTESFKTQFKSYVDSCLKEHYAASTYRQTT
jgi:glycosyltransferase involved in cell wall biosynthesis